MNENANIFQFVFKDIFGNVYLYTAQICYLATQKVTQKKEKMKKLSQKKKFDIEEKSYMSS